MQENIFKRGFIYLNTFTCSKQSEMGMSRMYPVRIIQASSKRIMGLGPSTDISLNNGLEYFHFLTSIIDLNT